MKVTTATMYETRIPTVIIHCCMIISEPRFFWGANSAMYAVAIAESAPTASPMRVRAASKMAALTARADSSAPTA